MRHPNPARTLFLAVLLGASVAGCGQKSATDVPSARYARDVIGPEEIAAVEPQTTAEQLIRRLRPHWLQGRGPVGVREEPPIPIYVNDQRAQDALHRYTAGDLLEIRFLNAMAATQRFGTGHTSGAILIITR